MTETVFFLLQNQKPVDTEIMGMMIGLMKLKCVSHNGITVSGKTVNLSISPDISQEVSVNWFSKCAIPKNMRKWKRVRWGLMVVSGKKQTWMYLNVWFQLCALSATCAILKWPQLFQVNTVWLRSYVQNKLHRRKQSFCKWTATPPPPERQPPFSSAPFSRTVKWTATVNSATDPSPSVSLPRKEAKMSEDERRVGVRRCGQALQTEKTEKATPPHPAPCRPS